MKTQAKCPRCTNEGMFCLRIVIHANT